MSKYQLLRMIMMFGVVCVVLWPSQRYCPNGFVGDLSKTTNCLSQNSN